ncbi:MAG: hypothetical protein ABI718_18385, partial [Acidobacteriota bacterium]
MLGLPIERGEGSLYAVVGDGLGLGLPTCEGAWAGGEDGGGGGGAGAPEPGAGVAGPLGGAMPLNFSSTAASPTTSSRES